MVELDAGKDYYRVLGVAVDATQDEVRRAYRELAKATHPDTGHGNTELFRAIQEAYDVLSDPLLQRAYSRQRAARFAGVGPVSLEVLQSRQVASPMEGDQLLYTMVEIQPQSEAVTTSGPRRTRTPLNLALVIDRSTSMQGARMQNVKGAASDLVEMLEPQDRLAIIAFSDRATLMAPSVHIRDKHHLRSAVSSITVGGGTEIYQGVAAGIDQVRSFASPEVISHVLLLTDGRTYGDEELALAAAARAEAMGIGLSAFGIGEDWNDTFLDQLAHTGGGTSHYIDRPDKVQAVIRERVAGLTNVVLRRAELRVTPAPYVRIADIHRFAPYMEGLGAATDGSAATVALGDLMGGESAGVALEFVISLNETGTRRIARLVLEGEAATSSSRLVPGVGARQGLGSVAGLPGPAPQMAGAPQTASAAWWHDIEVTFSDREQRPEEEQVSPKLMHMLARLSIFRLQERAWRAVEFGDASQAGRLLESAATRLFDLGYRDLGQAAMLEVSRIAQGAAPSQVGRKKIRYGTRALTIEPS